jgi:hypothetical protein
MIVLGYWILDARWILDERKKNKKVTGFSKPI